MKAHPALFEGEEGVGDGRGEGLGITNTSLS